VPVRAAPAGAAPITVTDPGHPRTGIAGWTDGHTSALLIWRGWEGTAQPEDPGLIESWTRTTTDERDALMTLASFGHHDNVELVGAWLLAGPAEAGRRGRRGSAARQTRGPRAGSLCLGMVAVAASWCAWTRTSQADHHQAVQAALQSGRPWPTRTSSHADQPVRRSADSARGRPDLRA
jgi:hypothetical protein